MTDSDFDTFFARRTNAAEAYTNGDFSPLAPLIAEKGTASFHSPRGDTVTEAEAVAERYRSDAQSFQAGGRSRFEILQKASSGDVGFWTGFQVATVNLAGKTEETEMRIRVTEVFRSINGAWKMVHRHADVAKS
jgi:ketosteroid isomerase-like protein